MELSPFGGLRMRPVLTSVRAWTLRALWYGHDSTVSSWLWTQVDFEGPSVWFEVT
jgi:hypothetical protein